MTATIIDAGDGLPLTVPSLLCQRAGAHPDTVFLACDDDRLTYAEAERASAELARGLIAVGAGTGTHVGILHPNGRDFVVSWLAAARIGAVSVPLSTFSTSAELATLLRGADIGVLLCARSYRSHDFVAGLGAAVPELDLGVDPPLLAESAPALRHVVVAGGVPGARPGWSSAALIAAGMPVDDDVLLASERAVGPADRMVIVHTSGSTSEPKGVIHTHGALIRHLDNLNEIRRYGPGDVLFSNSPFFWIGGFAYLLLGTLVAGATLVCSNATDAASVLDVIERERPTMVNGFAQTVAHLPADPSFSRRDLSSIRRGNLWPIMPPEVCPADPDLLHAMLGMTETGSVCLVSEDETQQPEHRRGSFGRPAPGLEARVVREDRGACATDEVGELLLRGPFMMEGYYGKERHEVFDPDGWYHSGDLVAVDADGFFFFKGRRGDMIKTSGANVSPREVEAVIADVAGLVAHVMGIEDAARGQIVVAAVRVPAGRTVDADELRTQMSARLSSYKVPRHFVLLADDDVPMMSSGKLDQRALREVLGEVVRGC